MHLFSFKIFILASISTDAIDSFYKSSCQREHLLEKGVYSEQSFIFESQWYHSGFSANFMHNVGSAVFNINSKGRILYKWTSKILELSYRTL